MIASIGSLALVLAIVPAPSFHFAAPPPVQTPAAPSPAAPSEVAPPPATPPPATPPPTSGGPPALPPVAGEAVEPPTSGGPPALPPAAGETVAPPPAAGDPAAPPPEPASPPPVDGPEPAPPQPGEVAGPPPSEAVPPPTLPPELVAEVIAAQPRATVPAPRGTGRGMLIAAGVVGGIAGVIKIGSTIAAVQQDDAFIVLAGAVYYSPMFATAIGLAGGGMARRGRADAHRELFENTPATRRRRKALGWGLFGAGMGVWALSRLSLVGNACGETDCIRKVLEPGYYLSLAGTIPGVIMGGYASGFDAYERRFGFLAQVSVSPMVRRGMQGLSLSGRF